MDVYAERFSADVLGIDACWIGQPVVGVNNVKLFGAGNNACYDGLVVYLFVQV